MHKKQATLLFSAIVCCFGGVFALPTHEYSAHSFGVEYYGLVRGQAITEQDVNSSSQFHGLSVSAAPFSFLICEAGFGVEDFNVEEYRQTEFEGGFGPAPFGGIALVTPVFIDHVQVAGGLDASYLHSSDKRSTLYSGALLNPFLGLSLKIGRYFGLQGGVKGHIIAGNMSNTRTNVDYGSFSNRNVVRGYVEALFKSPLEGGYISLYANGSPSADVFWDNGPVESTFGITLGVIVKGDKKSDTIKKKSDELFPAMQDMYDRSEDMKKKIED